MPSGDIHKRQVRCEGCPFKGPKVGSKGDPKSPIVFVAESPGSQEVRVGEPLVGPSGRIFHQFVPEDGSVLILNAIECSPLKALKNEKSLNVAVGCCREHLLGKVSSHPRRIIVAMGNAAVRSLTGDYSLKITQIRGRLIPSPLAELGIMPIVHIAALMRGGGSFRQWKQDIQYAMDLGLGADPIDYEPAVLEVIPDDITQEEVDDLFTRICVKNNRLTGDIETSGFDHIRDHILSLGITPEDDPTRSYCFYPNHWPLLESHLESPEISWAWHNGKFDIKFFRHIGIRARVDDDTMLLSYTLDEEGGVHDLETVASDVLGAPSYKHMLKPWLPNKNTSYAEVPRDVLSYYQAIDTANTAQIRTIYRERVRRDPDLEKLYVETLIPASAMLTQVEENGIQVDLERLEENNDYFLDMKATINEEINDLIGYEINPGSPKQVSRLFYKGYKFPNRSKGSTDEKTIKKLRRIIDHPIFALILKHRKAVKMHGTYCKGLLKHVQPETNRIHATYLIHGTRTGRLAARNSNMQNPPRDPQIRGTFIAAPGYELIEIDLSQAELRLIAAFSMDETLLDIFNNDGDVHGELAEQLFPGWHLSKDKNEKKEQRVKAKNVNFGIPYGITEFGLMEQIEDTVQEARRMLLAWDQRFPGARRFLDKCRNAPASNQVMTTCFGRKKRTGLVSGQNISFLMREASNFPPSSVSSDITLHAGIRTWKQLLSWDVRIVNLVHDSLIVESPKDPKNETRRKVIQLVAGELRQVPIDYGITAIPFKADAEYGHRWGSLDEYKGDIYG